MLLDQLPNSLPSHVLHIIASHDLHSDSTTKLYIIILLPLTENFTTYFSFLSSVECLYYIRQLITANSLFTLKHLNLNNLHTPTCNDVTYICLNLIVKYLLD